MPESSINYEMRDTNKAIEWNLHNFLTLQIEPTQTRKQDIFISESEVYFESKWSLVELNNSGVKFAEFNAGSPWSQSLSLA